LPPRSDRQCRPEAGFRCRLLQDPANMRTSKSTITFRRPFILNDNVGELPAGSYDIEIDEEEILGADRIGYRRIATYFYVSSQGSTRMLTIDPAELDAAVEQDAQAEHLRHATHSPDGAYP